MRKTAYEDFRMPKSVVSQATGLHAHLGCGVSLLTSMSQSTLISASTSQVISRYHCSSRKSSSSCSQGVILCDQDLIWHPSCHLPRRRSIYVICNAKWSSSVTQRFRSGGTASAPAAGLMAPAGTPRAVVDRLNADTLKALQIPAVKTRLEDIGGEVRGSTPEEMKAMVASELSRWVQVVADAKIPKQ